MKQKEVWVQKASGETEPFSIEKLISSLSNSGANIDETEEIAAEITKWIYNGISTRQIYSRAFELLKHKRAHFASRYKLKKAIMELGPTGYPFEYFIGKLFDIMGYKTTTGIVMQGCCVTHEMDVVAIKDHEEHLVECKYSQSHGKSVSVQVPLYVRSRVDDIVKQLKKSPEYEGYTFHGWVVTNTRFTSDAIDYGNCSGLHMLSWDYPTGNGMKDIIDREKVYPITVLANLSHKQKQELMDKGIVICRQLSSNPEILTTLNLTKSQIMNLMQELNELVPFS
ncbi:MAG TPA: restriction endonuclease [Mariniphaga sp.]|nr:restriction endonuclease [Mariniphaga sp.]